MEICFSPPLRSFSLWCEVSYLHMVLFGTRWGGVKNAVTISHGWFGPNWQRSCVGTAASLLSEYYLSLWLSVGASIKMASFVVQLAQDHVVLEEELVSHAESAERNDQNTNRLLLLAGPQTNRELFPREHFIFVFFTQA